MPNVEDLYSAKARATSPDRSVTAVMSIDGVRVELAPRCLQRHDVNTLATSVKAALNGAISGWDKVNEHVMPGDPDTLEGPTADRLAPFLEALAEVKVVVEHPLVKVGIHKHEARVAFAAEALRLPEDALSEHVNEALADLMRTHRQRVAALYELLVTDRE